MDTLFHFLFSVIAGMAIFHGKHRLHVVASLAFISTLVDSDHFLGMAARGTFHNVFIIFLVPSIAFLTLYYHNGRKSFGLQSYTIILMAMMAGHVAADMFYGGGVMLLYPVSSESFSVPNMLPDGEIFGRSYESFISRDGIALAVYSLILLLAYFAEDFIYFFEKKHEKVKQAIINAKTDLF